ncbi:MAG: Na+/Pi-cotransporter [Methanomicrobiales archaeon 53_19]|uniref:Na/Pi cotransporter family protein n=1 Tax=Methanocalculus sp. TaxID=2004547 RepID=UPI0007486205|nr:Na/Pi cotransporter family protein [Methanocalculus sp.]KUK69900.1 MAG: Na+/Pi-cotransporter [Methanocalculus sp. 52_23]KUL03145.1 MAG: Na+/Pi-cotransporter [Methanomicrobiales archaeon 53_19]HIJ07307.1 Na/Pi cotransporter family protein [Methanocalculus sp.]
MVATWELIFTVVPGVILFLFGIENFSKEILAVARGRFAAILGDLTTNRYKGLLLGAGITALVQSSAATTVIAINLVNAGTISFVQSLGIIIGSNIGTTITSQLVAFKLTSFGPVFIIAGFLIGLIGGRYKFLGKPLFYFGLVFFGLTLVNNGIDPYKNDPLVLELLGGIAFLPLAIFVGFLVTTAFQSSSVTTGLVVILAQQGMITMPEAIPFLLGANIGSTTTALFASRGLDLYARRAAAAHTLFNIGGVLLIIPFLVPFVNLIAWIGGTEAQQVANAHLVFNVIASGIFIIALHPFARLVIRLVPGEEEEILFRTVAIRKDMPQSPDEALPLIEEEVQHLYEITHRAFDAAIAVFDAAKPSRAYQKAGKLELVNDYIDEEIEKAVFVLSSQALSETEASRTVLLVRISNELERLADLARDLAKVGRNAHRKGSPFPKGQVEAIRGIYRIFDGNILELARNFPHSNKETINSLRARDIELQRALNLEYSLYLRRIAELNESGDSRYLEVLSILEAANGKIRDIRKLTEDFSALDEQPISVFPERTV